MAAKSICDPYSPQALALDANIAVDGAVGGVVACVEAALSTGLGVNDDLTWLTHGTSRLFDKEAADDQISLTIFSLLYAYICNKLNVAKLLVDC